MKRIVFLFVFVVSGTLASAQADFTFRYMEDKLDVSGINSDKLRGHFLGEDIAKKLYLLKESYTYMEAASTTTATAATLRIDKPAIYNNVKKLEKYYKKSIKKGTITEETAKEEFVEVIDIALFIRNQQTIEFEETLENTKDPKELVTIFTENVNLEVY